MKKLRVVLAQLNLHVGNIQANLEKHLEAATRARDELSADIIIFPELSLPGYPPEDLLLRNDFLHATQQALQTFVNTMQGIYCLLGHPHQVKNGLQNACSFIYNGKILGRYAKQHLPNYGVFDEDRYFIPGNDSCVIPINNIPTGLVICEDIWFKNPTHRASLEGARLILSPNASPFEVNKHEERIAVLTERARQNSLSIVYVNQVGGQDELVFDGGSMVVNKKGELCQFAGFFNETLLPVDIEIDTGFVTPPPSFSVPNKEDRIYSALVTGVRDYVNKNHFPGVLVGVSGGIDSALTLAIAVDALGKERVRAVLLPSRYTADISNEDAKLLLRNLEIEAEVIPIESTHQAFLSTLAPSFKNTKPDVTEENLQARCRAVILMALSNKFGHLLLTTGNRSELAVGYCTLYGDMAGGFAVLKDIPKTLVYALAHYRNQIHPVIPKRTLTRAPTAELAPDQKDEDSLPPYHILDQILEYYLNDGKSMEEIVAAGFEAEVVKKVVSLIRKNEYKRRQAAIGTHINHKSFGKDWRYPLTNGFKG